MPDISETTESVAVENQLSAKREAELHPLVADIEAKFFLAKSTRYEDESRWNRAYYNYRGLYGKEIQFRDDEKSRVFVKITKQKVMAAYGHIADVMFAGEQVPITIEATPDPEGIMSEAHIDVNDPKEEEGPSESLAGFPGDGRDLDPGATIQSRLGAWLSAKEPE